jgi:hypothetical protein
MKCKLPKIISELIKSKELYLITLEFKKRIINQV